MVRVLESTRDRWICTLRRDSRGLRLIPFGGLEAAQLVLRDKDTRGAEDGTRVVVAPIEARRASGPSKTAPPLGRRRSRTIPVRVIEILGKPLDPESDHRALVWKHRLATQFPRRARLEVEEIEADLSRAELARRIDLRALPFITIDPASARDHDDAVFAEVRPAEPVALVDSSGRHRRKPDAASWTQRLWVAIADVSHFVSAGGWVDSEARRRGNSFYFPDRSIPMLPERLSSELCSLRPDVDRLAMVVELRLQKDGQVVDALFHEAVIRSRARLAYEDAARWLESDRLAKTAEAVEWGDSLRRLDAIAHSLGRLRRRAGSLMLELPEIEITVDAEGHPVDARIRERNRAHELIEEAMLAANRAVARALDRAERDSIHRVHPPPSPEKLAALGALLDRLAIGFEGDLEAPGVLAKVLEDVKGAASEERIHMAVLRSMSQARYEARSRGHFALRFEHYVHFTSPIRRYADLAVHRALKDLIRGEPPASQDSTKEAAERVERLCVWLSGRERVATEVERDAEALACCALMSGREGDRFEARVTSATEFGLFIRLESPAASGLVPMRLLEGSWLHDPEAEVLIGERSGARIGLGDRVSVRLVEVDVDRARLAFRLVSQEARTRGRSRD
jgi:ribonuclease R